MKKNIRQGVLISLILVILIAGGISCFTWNIGRLFVSLVAAEPSASVKDQEVIESNVLHLPEVKLWICQIGVYKEKTNAEKIQQLLKSQGLMAVIFTANDSYTTAIGAFLSRENALQYSGTITQTVQNWVKAAEYPQRHYKITGKDITTASLILETANTVLTQPEEDWDIPQMQKEIQSVSDDKCPTDFQDLKKSVEMLFSAGTDTQSQQLLQVYADYMIVTAKYS
ncbi:SPOR domain-containing protein [Dehalobacter sp. DCM]|uniref:SPOR domain-containing protein n=1 Tax=Dehalobacter sp. DCM TaxID=2907827 RepID=UPI00308167BC|nr:SPOR domain-containing protein [Dehalobacter sp. DCM]